jgi:hypothetical protein
LLELGVGSLVTLSFVDLSELGGERKGELGRVNKEELGGENKGNHLSQHSRAKEVSPNPNSLLSLCCLFVVFSSSPTLSHCFFSLILLQVHLKLEENGILLVYHSIFILMVLVGTMHQRKEEDSGHTLSDLQYEDEEGFEEG